MDDVRAVHKKGIWVFVGFAQHRGRRLSRFRLNAGLLARRPYRKSVRLPGRMIRSISRSACAGLVAKITPKTDRTTSAAASSTGNANRSPSRRSSSTPGSGRARAQPRAAAELHPPRPPAHRCQQRGVASAAG